MFRFSAGSPSVPNVSPIIGACRVRPSSRHGYSGEYFANTPSTGSEVSASEMRLRSFASSHSAVTLVESAPTVKVRRSCSLWSTMVELVIARLSSTARRSSAAPW
jgi:hypothetical protein